MSWLKKDLALLSRTAEEEFYEALAQAHDRGGWATNPGSAFQWARAGRSLPPLPPIRHAGDGTGEEEHGEWLHASEEGSTAHGLALHRCWCMERLQPLLLPSPSATKLLACCHATYDCMIMLLPCCMLPPLPSTFCHAAMPRVTPCDHAALSDPQGRV